jgi:ferredoxin
MPNQRNVPGPFWVNQECICCSVCSELASAHFRLADDETQNIVYQQPETEEEYQTCKEAQENCPVEAIEEQATPACF